MSTTTSILTPPLKCTDSFLANMGFLHPRMFHSLRTRGEYRAKEIAPPSPSLVENKPTCWSGLACSQLCFGSYKKKAPGGYVFLAGSSWLVLIGGTTKFYNTPRRQGNLLPREELGHRPGRGCCSLCFCLQRALLFCYYLWGREGDQIHD